MGVIPKLTPNRPFHWLELKQKKFARHKVDTIDVSERMVLRYNLTCLMISSPFVDRRLKSCYNCGRRGGLMLMCIGLWIEWSRFEPWPGHIIVISGNALYLQCLSPPRRINRYWRIARE